MFSCAFRTITSSRFIEISTKQFGMNFDAGLGNGIVAEGSMALL